MEDLVLHKVRLAVLWLMAMVSDVASVLLYIMNPAILDKKTIFFGVDAFPPFL